MSRKRPRPGAEPLGLRRRRAGGRAEADAPGGAAGARGAGGGPPGPGAARAAVAELGRLFPRGLFEDALPPIALRSQVYSLVPDRTAADRQLKELQEQGEIRVIQLGFDLDAHGIVLTEDYRTRVLRACDGRAYAGAVQKFLALVLPACGDLSFQQDQMTQTFGFRDTEITAPGCPWHGPEGQVPGAAPVGAPGPAGACLGETRPCLPRARPHRGPAGGLVSLAQPLAVRAATTAECPHHFWNPLAPARDVRVCTPRQACGGPGPGVLPGG
ncbi:serine/threonine-protein kinase 19 isoform X2 [Pipistrellus kuhlii]|uniref:serine/threonine-protein kinase 19 isoform X2 n=1 Tax=Pipistrellus kuhlii TaxID=59472 RepID=UPI001E270FCF|nr:serine/threonine-protein kinase 19 isoform X2 [Pipistrellus kuhlii]